MFLITDYKDGQSVLVYKAHHVFCDGLGVAAKFLALSDHYDMNALPALKPMSFCKNVVLYICLPFLVLRATFDMLFLKF